MELCTNHGVLNLQHRCQKAFNFRPTPLLRALSLSLSPTLIQTSRCRVKSELRLRTLSLRASSEETSAGQTDYAKGTRDAATTFEDASPFERNAQIEVVEPEKQIEENAPDDESATFELLDKLDEKLDTDSTALLFLYGGGAIVSIWLASAVVGAIDAIPVVPKLMQVVGIAYTVWFTSRYLIFKKSRDELAIKIEELKSKILGSEWN
ncbi:unnamed protein product [Rhodiola kirilowii]